MSEIVTRLRQLAQSAPNESLRSETVEFADRLEAALNDADGVIEIDEHFPLDVAARELGQAYGMDASGAYTEQATFLYNLRQQMWQGYDESSRRFRPYTIEGAHRPDVTLAPSTEGFSFGVRLGESRKIRNKDSSTYIDLELFDRLLGERYAPQQGSADGVTTDTESRVHGRMTIVDREADSTLQAHQLLDAVRTELTLQSNLAVGPMLREPNREFDFVSLAQGAEGIGVRDFNGLRLPGFMNRSSVNVRGVRVAFVLAAELAERGRIAEDDLNAWIAEDDASAAANAVAQHYSTVHAEAYNEYSATFLSGMSDNVDPTREAGAQYDRFQFLLEHGVVALTFDEDFSQSIPDYQYRGQSVVRTPTGPAMLLFDGPVPDLSAEGIHDRYPDDRDYVFGLTSLSFVERETTPSVQYDWRRPAVFPELGSSDLSYDVNASYSRMIELVDRIEEDPSATRDYSLEREIRDSERNIIEELSILEPLVERAERELMGLRVELQALEARAALRHGLPFDRDRLSMVRDRVADLEQYIEDGAGARGLGRRALVLHGDAYRDVDGEAYLSDVDSAASRMHDAPALADGAREVLVAQSRLTEALRFARLQAAEGVGDHVDLQERMYWWQEYGFTDWLTLGTSPQGRAYRASDDALENESGRVGELRTLTSRGEALANRSLDTLLSSEVNADGELGEAAARYVNARDEVRRLEPLHDQLQNVGGTAATGRAALDRAEWAWRRYDMEPSTTIETYVDHNGDLQTRIVDNPWKDIYWSMARQASAEAEREIRSLNDEVQRLADLLASGDFADDFASELPELRENINWFTGGFWGHGWSSWGYSRERRHINQIQGELEDVIDRVRPLVSQIGAPYTENREIAATVLRNRRIDLLN